MKIGMEYEKKIIVSDVQTAKVMGSGDLEVFATPSMIALMEGCAAESVADSLEYGLTTVGTFIQVKHLAATPVGMEVCCKSILKEIDGRALRFEIEAWDESGLIGSATHERFIVVAEKFLQNTYKKLEK